MDWVEKPQNNKDLYRIVQLLRGSHLNNFLLKTLKTWLDNFLFVNTAVEMFIDFQFYQCKKLTQVLSRFYIY